MLIAFNECFNKGFLTINEAMVVQCYKKYSSSAEEEGGREALLNLFKIMTQNESYGEKFTKLVAGSNASKDIISKINLNILKNIKKITDDTNTYLRSFTLEDEVNQADKDNDRNLDLTESSKKFIPNTLVYMKSQNPREAVVEKIQTILSDGYCAIPLYLCYDYQKLDKHEYTINLIMVYGLSEVTEEGLSEKDVGCIQVTSNYVVEINNDNNLDSQSKAYKGITNLTIQAGQVSLQEIASFLHQAQNPSGDSEQNESSKKASIGSSKIDNNSEESDEKGNNDVDAKNSSRFMSSSTKYHYGYASQTIDHNEKDGKRIPDRHDKHELKNAPLKMNLNLITQILTSSADIESAFFKAGSERKEFLEPRRLTITKESFNDSIKEQYKHLINNSGSNSSEKYVKYLEQFTYALDDDWFNLTIYPAYSKNTQIIGHNQSGDTSLQIECSSGKTIKFVFDAPSVLREMDWDILRCFNEASDNDECLAMHAKLLFILHFCSNKDFVVTDELYGDDYDASNRMPYLALSLPYAWAETGGSTHRIMVSGDCNALIQHGTDLLFPMAAGCCIPDNTNIEDGKSDPWFYYDAYNKLYKTFNNTLSTREHLEALKALGAEYLLAKKNYTIPEGGINCPVEVQHKIDGNPVKIILVSDGATDNPELLNGLKSIMNGSNDNFSSFMNKVKGYMNKIDSEDSKFNMKEDDFATPLIVHQRQVNLRVSSLDDSKHFQNASLIKGDGEEIIVTRNNNLDTTTFDKHRRANPLPKGTLFLTGLSNNRNHCWLNALLTILANHNECSKVLATYDATGSNGVISHKLAKSFNDFFAKKHLNDYGLVNKYRDELLDTLIKFEMAYKFKTRIVLKQDDIKEAQEDISRLNGIEIDEIIEKMSNSSDFDNINNTLKANNVELMIDDNRQVDMREIFSFIFGYNNASNPIVTISNVQYYLDVTEATNKIRKCSTVGELAQVVHTYKPDLDTAYFNISELQNEEAFTNVKTSSFEGIIIHDNSVYQKSELFDTEEYNLRFIVDSEEIATSIKKIAEKNKNAIWYEELKNVLDSLGDETMVKNIEFIFHNAILKTALQPPDKTEVSAIQKDICKSGIAWLLKKVADDKEFATQNFEYTARISDQKIPLFCDGMYDDKNSDFKAGIEHIIQEMPTGYVINRISINNARRNEDGVENGHYITLVQTKDGIIEYNDDSVCLINFKGTLTQYLELNCKNANVGLYSIKKEDQVAQYLLPVQDLRINDWKSAKNNALNKTVEVLNTFHNNINALPAFSYVLDKMQKGMNNGGIIGQKVVEYIDILKTAKFSQKDSLSLFSNILIMTKHQGTGRKMNLFGITNYTKTAKKCISEVKTTRRDSNHSKSSSAVRYNNDNRVTNPLTGIIETTKDISESCTISDNAQQIIGEANKKTIQKKIDEIYVMKDSEVKENSGDTKIEIEHPNEFKPSGSDFFDAILSDFLYGIYTPGEQPTERLKDEIFTNTQGTISIRVRSYLKKSASKFLEALRPSGKIKFLTDKEVTDVAERLGNICKEHNVQVSDCFDASTDAVTLVNNCTYKICYDEEAGKYMLLDGTWIGFLIDGLPTNPPKKCPPEAAQEVYNKFAMWAQDRFKTLRFYGGEDSLKSKNITYWSTHNESDVMGIKLESSNDIQPRPVLLHNLEKRIEENNNESDVMDIKLESSNDIQPLTILLNNLENSIKENADNEMMVEVVKQVFATADTDNKALSSIKASELTLKEIELLNAVWEMLVLYIRDDKVVEKIFESNFGEEITSRIKNYAASSAALISISLTAYEDSVKSYIKHALSFDINSERRVGAERLLDMSCTDKNTYSNHNFKDSDFVTTLFGPGDITMKKTNFPEGIFAEDYVYICTPQSEGIVENISGFSTIDAFNLLKPKELAAEVVNSVLQCKLSEITKEMHYELLQRAAMGDPVIVDNAKLFYELRNTAPENKNGVGVENYTQVGRRFSGMPLSRNTVSLLRRINNDPAISKEYSMMREKLLNWIADFTNDSVSKDDSIDSIDSIDGDDNRSKEVTGLIAMSKF